jgi:hypothetical protein
MVDLETPARGPKFIEAAVTWFRAVFRARLRDLTPGEARCLIAMADLGGIVDDTDPFLTEWSEEIAACRRRGLINSGSGWDAGWWLSPRGRDIAATLKTKTADQSDRIRGE